MALAFALPLIFRPGFATPFHSTHKQMPCIACHDSPYSGSGLGLTRKLDESSQPQVGEANMPDWYTAKLSVLIDSYPVATSDSYKNTNKLVPNFRPWQLSQDYSGTVNLNAGLNLPLPIIPLRKTLNLIFSMDLGPFAPAFRAGYISWSNPEVPANSPGIAHIQLGRFQVPFGLPTDQPHHIARLISKTTAQDFVSGIKLSGPLPPQLLFNFAIFHEMTNTQSSLPAPQQLGIVFNTYTHLDNWIWGGASALISHHQESATFPHAFSLFWGANLAKQWSNLALVILQEITTSQSILSAEIDPTTFHLLFESLSNKDDAASPYAWSYTLQLHWSMFSRAQVHYHFHVFNWNLNDRDQYLQKNRLGFDYQLRENLSLSWGFGINQKSSLLNAAYFPRRFSLLALKGWW